MYEPFAYDRATKASNKIKQFILGDNHDGLINFQIQDKAFELSIQTPEHCLTLLYVMALKDEMDEVG